MFFYIIAFTSHRPHEILQQYFFILIQSLMLPRSKENDSLMIMFRRLYSQIIKITQNESLVVIDRMTIKEITRVMPQRKPETLWNKSCKSSEIVVLLKGLVKRTMCFSN